MTGSPRCELPHTRQACWWAAVVLRALVRRYRVNNSAGCSNVAGTALSVAAVPPGMRAGRCAVAGPTAAAPRLLGRCPLTSAT